MAAGIRTSPTAKRLGQNCRTCQTRIVIRLLLFLQFHLPSGGNACSNVIDSTNGISGDREGGGQMTDEDRHNSGGEAWDPDRRSPGDVPGNEREKQTGAGTVDAHQAVDPMMQTTPPPVQPPAPAPAANRNFLYAAMSVVIGILVGVSIGAMNLYPSKPAPASGTPPEITVAPDLSGPHLPRDMGVADADASGLKGHLIAIWNGKLAFRLNVEPIDPEDLPGFARAVTSSPKPLSIAINLKDSSGRFICSQDILLKYTQHPTAATPPLVNGKPAKKGSPEAIDFDTWQKSELESLRMQEQEREQGKEIFQNDLDQDGHLKSISVEGDTQCPLDVYETFSFWNLTTNFPSLDEQAALLGSSPQQPGANNKSAAHTGAKYTAAPKPGDLSMEGEDTIAEYDANAGIIETAAARTFFVDKSGGEGNAARWRDYRGAFQYKCDQNAACTLTRAGAGVLHARLKK